jgi:hypothetical protein
MVDVGGPDCTSTLLSVGRRADGWGPKTRSHFQRYLVASINLKVRRWVQRALVDIDALRRLFLELNLVLRPSCDAAAPLRGPPSAEAQTAPA